MDYSESEYEAIKFATLCRMMGGHPQFLRFGVRDGKATIAVRCYDGKPISPDMRIFKVSPKFHDMLSGTRDWYIINSKLRHKVESAYESLVREGYKKEVVV